MTTVAERQYLLNELNRLAQQDLTVLWRQLSTASDLEFAQMVAEAFPELTEPYVVAAAEMAAEWYAESAPDLPYRPTSFLPPAEGVPASVSWALGASGDAALSRLEGVAQRQIWTANRETIVGNSRAEAGSTWARVARPGACAFCAMVATRAAVYTSEAAALRVVGRGVQMTAADRRIREAGENKRRNGQFAAAGVKTRGSQKLGDKYHDHCHCQAKEVRPGQSYEPPEYVQKFQDAYREAIRAVPQGTPMDETVAATLAGMRTALGSH